MKSIQTKETTTNKTRDDNMYQPGKSTQSLWQVVQNPNTVDKTPGSLKRKHQSKHSMLDLVKNIINSQGKKRYCANAKNRKYWQHNKCNKSLTIISFDVKNFL